MLYDNDGCDCTRARVEHPALHIVCCRCIFCSPCGRWIRAGRWRDHQEKPHESASEAGLPVPAREDDELVPDSLEIALHEVSGVDLVEIDGVFRVAVRSCIGLLIDHLEELGGPYRADRTMAWEAVLQLLLDGARPQAEKVRLLLELFDEPSDDLEAQIVGVVVSAAELFPSRALRR